LVNRLAELQIYKKKSPVIRGDLQFIYKDKSKADFKNIVGVRWIDDPEGPVYVAEKPLWEEQHTEIGENGEEVKMSYKEMSDLYVAGIDAIDIG
jgi:hypothetical protein